MCEGHRLLFRLLVLTAALTGLSHAAMELVTMPGAVAQWGARCLDGSPAAYYYRAATSAANATKWVLFFEGGGGCFTPESCLARAQTRLGSSTLMPRTATCGGPLDEDAAANDFASWHHVLFAYCDGASFAGAAAEPLRVGRNATVHLRGHANFVAAMHELLAARGLDRATHVLLTGDSAGGIATFAHADAVAALLPRSVVRYKAAPMSGLFLRHANVRGAPVYEAQMRRVWAMQNLSATTSTRCQAAQAAGAQHRCVFGADALPFVATPVFVVNSIYDKWSLNCIWTAEPVRAHAPDACNCTAVPEWRACLRTGACSAAQWARLNRDWGDDFRATLAANRALTAPGNGVYAYSCYDHGAELTAQWNTLRVGGVSVREALTRWFFSDGEPAARHTYVDCRAKDSFLCNPTCATPAAANITRGAFQ